MNDVEQYILDLIRPMLKPGAYMDIEIKTQDGRLSHVHTGNSEDIPKHLKKKPEGS